MRATTATDLRATLLSPLQIFDGLLAFAAFMLYEIVAVAVISGPAISWALPSATRVLQARVYVNAFVHSRVATAGSRLRLEQARCCLPTRSVHPDYLHSARVRAKA